MFLLASLSILTPILVLISSSINSHGILVIERVPDLLNLSKSFNFERISPLSRFSPFQDKAIFSKGWVYFMASLFKSSLGFIILSSSIELLAQSSDGSFLSKSMLVIIQLSIRFLILGLVIEAFMPTLGE